MKIYEIAFVVLILGTFGLMFYSVIRWIAVLIADRSDIKRRKKYSIMCLISMVIIVLSMVISFIINFKRNTM